MTEESPRYETNELVERLKLEALAHAQEARTQRAIVQEILQIVSGATGESGDWNATRVVREKFDDLREKLRDAERVNAHLKEALIHLLRAIELEAIGGEK